MRLTKIQLMGILVSKKSKDLMKSIHTGQEM